MIEAPREISALVGVPLAGLVEPHAVELTLLRLNISSTLLKPPINLDLYHTCVRPVCRFLGRRYFMSRKAGQLISPGSRTRLVSIRSDAVRKPICPGGRFFRLAHRNCDSVSAGRKIPIVPDEKSPTP